MKKNKRGWLKIVEAFIAVFLIISVALFVVNRDFIEKRNISEKIYAAEVQLLQEVIDTYPKEEIKEHIENYEISDLLIPSRKPEYLGCEVQYYIEDPESWEPEPSLDLEERDIYVQTLPILSENPEVDDLLIRAICWLE